MFVGHYGISFAAKAADPSLPLAALMISTQVLDIAWSTFVLTGVEKVRIVKGFTRTNDLDLYFLPYSHGLITAAGWSAVAGAATWWLMPGHGLAAALIMAAVCFSHWLLDLIVHVPDLPLVGNRWKVGFGLWNARWLSLALELAVLFGGAVLLMADPATSPGMRWFTLGFSVALAALHIYSLFGPAPKSASEMAGSALAAYVLIAAVAFAGAWAFQTPVARAADGDRKAGLPRSVESTQLLLQQQAVASSEMQAMTSTASRH